MKFDSSTTPTPPTPQQLTEINDVLVSATELCQIYSTLARHPRVVGSPGASELFESCLDQMNQDMTVLDEQLENLQSLAQSLPAETEQEPDDRVMARAATAAAPPRRFQAFPDVEPADIKKTVFETVRKAFLLEDFLRRQLYFSLVSAQSRRHLKLELQLKMIVLSGDQRCRLLEERYGFARSKSVLVQGLRRQTTRFLSKLNGEKREDID
jgi:hypothetical protein